MNKYSAMLFVLAASIISAQCSGDRKDPDPKLTRLSVDRHHFKDEYGRYVLLNGINVSGTNKAPSTPGIDEDPRGPIDPATGKHNQTVSFVGRPFPLEKADEWFKKIRDIGFNSIRLVINWEAIEHDGRGVYDQEYLKYLDGILASAHKNNVYVLLNFHENLFSRLFYTNITRQTDPCLGEKGSIEAMIASLFPTIGDDDELIYTGRIGGDGAPRWAVESCVPEKNIDSPQWGMFKLLSAFGDDYQFDQIKSAIEMFTGGGEPAAPVTWADGSGGACKPNAFMSFLGSLNVKMGPQGLGVIPFDVKNSNDVYPLTDWYTNTILSYDIGRCYAGFYHGDKVFPNATDKQGKKIDLKKYMQGWVQYVKDDDFSCQTINGGAQASCQSASKPGLNFSCSVDAKSAINNDHETDAYIDENAPEPVPAEKFRCVIDKPHLVKYGKDFDGRVVCAKGLDGSFACEKQKAAASSGYAGSWVEVAKLARKYDNIIGYDLVNEPPGAYVVLAAAALFFKSDFQIGPVQNLLTELIGQEMGEKILRLLIILNIIPIFPDQSYFNDLYIACPDSLYNIENNKYKCDRKAKDLDDAGKAQFLLDHKADLDAYIADAKKKFREDYQADNIDMMGALDMTLGFAPLLVDLYARVGMAVQDVDPNAIIWLESGGGLDLGVSDVNMWKPEGIKQLVITPHYYPDIYPYFGLNSPPRDFEVEEWILADFTPDIKSGLEAPKTTFGDVPVVFGEFGTYFNYNGIEASKASGYRISSEILDNYYEAYENLFLSRILWNLTIDNTYEKGDQWNYEDFSIVGPAADNYPLRSELAWSRPYPMAMSGKPLATHFYSDFHYYDPDKGKPDPWREFYLKMGSKEVDAPTAIYIPKAQYPDGFYVWLSDGWAQYNDSLQTLYYFPTKDDPSWEHEVTVRPPQKGREYAGWNYFFKGNRALQGLKR